MIKNMKALYEAMRKGAPGAMIVMSPAEAAGMLKEAERATRRSSRVQTARARSLADALRVIRELYPSASLPALASVLGVSRQYLYRTLSEAKEEETPDTLGEVAVSEEAAQSDTEGGDAPGNTEQA